MGFPTLWGYTNLELSVIILNSLELCGSGLPHISVLHQPRTIWSYLELSGSGLPYIVVLRQPEIIWNYFELFEIIWKWAPPYIVVLHQPRLSSQMQ